MATEPTSPSELRRRAEDLRAEARDYRRKLASWGKRLVIGSETCDLIRRVADDCDHCATTYEALAEEQEKVRLGPRCEACGDFHTLDPEIRVFCRLDAADADSAEGGTMSEIIERAEWEQLFEATVFPRAIRFIGTRPNPRLLQHHDAALRARLVEAERHAETYRLDLNEMTTNCDSLLIERDAARDEVQRQDEALTLLHRWVMARTAFDGYAASPCIGGSETWLKKRHALDAAMQEAEAALLRWIAAPNPPEKEG